MVSHIMSLNLLLIDTGQIPLMLNCTKNRSKINKVNFRLEVKCMHFHERQQCMQVFNIETYLYMLVFPSITVAQEEQI